MFDALDEALDEYGRLDGLRFGERLGEFFAVSERKSHCLPAAALGGLDHDGQSDFLGSRPRRIERPD